MSVKHAIIKDKNLIMSTMVGEIDDNKLMAAYQRLYTMDGWLPVRDQLIDIRKADTSQITMAGIQSFATLVAENEIKPVRYRTAVVVESAEQQAAISEYLREKQTDTQLLQIFSSVHTAIEWLNVEGLIAA